MEMTWVIETASVIGGFGIVYMLIDRVFDYIDKRNK